MDIDGMNAVLAQYCYKKAYIEKIYGTCNAMLINDRTVIKIESGSERMRFYSGKKLLFSTRNEPEAIGRFVEAFWLWRKNNS